MTKTSFEDRGITKEYPLKHRKFIEISLFHIANLLVMKTNQIETTRLLISQIQEKHDLTQREIASRLRLSEPELSKAKNPKQKFINELSEERRAVIISSL